MTSRWFSPGTLVSSTNNTDRHDLTEILLKVALNPITVTLTPFLLRYNLIFLPSSVDNKMPNIILYLYTLTSQDLHTEKHS